MFLKDEDPTEFWSDVNERIREEGATSKTEKDVIATIVYSRWTKRRAINANATAINEERDEICDRFDDGNVQETRHWIDRIATEPDVAVDELSRSKSGCKYLIGQFKLLDQRLDAYCAFEIGQRRDALRMDGHRLDEIFKDQVVFDLNKAYLGGISGTAGFTAGEASNAFMHDRPKDMGPIEFVRMLEPLVKDTPSLQEGQRRMKAFIARALERLKERKKLVGHRQERRLVAALNTAQAPVDRAAVTRARYANDSDRILFTSVRLLLALKKERREHGDVDPGPPIDDGVKGEPVADPAQSGEPREVERNDDLIQASDGGGFHRRGSPSAGGGTGRDQPNSERSRGARNRWPGRGLQPGFAASGGAPGTAELVQPGALRGGAGEDPAEDRGDPQRQSDDLQSLRSFSIRMY